MDGIVPQHLHAGVTLPTGSANDAVVDQATGGQILPPSAFAASLLALPELYDTFNKATSGRLGISPAFNAGRWFAWLDLGVVNALAISARAETSSVSPCLAVMFPVEEDISREVTWGATLGVDVKLP
jgi:hypothetical protein